MVNNHQYNKNYYWTICICMSLGSGTESVVLRGITNNGASSSFVSFTPISAGTYYYQCTLHAGMVGTIIVN